LLNQGGLIDHRTRRYRDTDVQPGISYNYTLVVVTGDGREIVSQRRTARFPGSRLLLFQNYPNPFNPTTNIVFTLPEAGPVSLSIYSPQGTLVKTLVNGIVPLGIKMVTWDGTDNNQNRVSSGIYFYRLRAGEKILTKKMILAR
jgi:hypothetical protein